MTLGLWGWLSAVGLPLVLGAAVLALLGVRRRDEPLGYWGFAYAIGALGVGAWLFAFAAAGLPLDVALVWPPIAVTAAGVCAIARVRRAAHGEREPEFDVPDEPRAVRWERRLLIVVAAVLAALAVDRAFVANGAAVVGGDEAHLYASKAKVLWHAGAFDADYAEELGREVRVGPRTLPAFVQHADYPPLDSLLQVWVFSHHDGITQAANRFPVQLFAPALVLCLASALARRLRPAAAAGLLLVIAAQPAVHFHATTAYADGLVAVGFLLAVDGWLRWRGSGEDRWLGVSALGAAAMVAAKNEGAMLLAVSLAAAALVWALDRFPRAALPRPSRAAWILAPLAWIAASAWHARAFTTGNDLLSQNPRGEPFWRLALEQAPERAVPVLEWFAARVLFDPAHSSLLLPAIALLVVLAPGSLARARAARGPLLAILFALATYAFVFVGSPHELLWHLETAGARVSHQVVPAAAAVFAVLLAAAFPALGARER